MTTTLPSAILTWDNMTISAFASSGWLSSMACSKPRRSEALDKAT